MEQKKDFLKKCEYLTNEEIGHIEKAIHFIEKILNKETIPHNLRIASFLADSKLSADIIIAGLLYKTESYKTEIEKIFGKEMFDLILGQQQIKKIKEQSKFSKTNPVRQIILTTIKDPRIIFVKLAAKLSNLKRMNHFPDKQKKEIAKEVIDLYVPLANRLGLEHIRKDLLDSAFEIVNPKKYQEIQKFLKESEEERKAHIKKIINDFQKLLEKEINVLKIKGREKQLYSIYKKITERKKPLHKQRDHFAIRIITGSPEECYTALVIITDKYKALKSSTKDYIKDPKKNGYQSLHTTILLENKKMLEVQIRTKEMDEIAEEGVAAHYLYKGMTSNKTFEKKTAWLKEILNLQQKGAVNELKLNLFQDKIYCYTPKGEAYNFPKGSTVLDFAYRVHGEIGSKAIGGIVNKKFTPLKTIVKNGDIIKIITNKFQRPRRSWMKFIVTDKAKKLISRDVQRFENIPVARTYLKEKIGNDKEEKIVEITEFPKHEPIFARCCLPIPPQELIGIIRSQKKILIHNQACERIKDSKKSQVLAVWKDAFEKPIRIFATTKERSGILADLLNTILRLSIKALETNAKLAGDNQIECSFLLEIDTLEKLEETIERLKKIDGVKKIWVE
ncbi:MAG: HD domain-containing protein [Nanoarchaeota archaeon]|jgi:guanosine-3',5'-bis(diphosphate) 3'-pyrophosphohydrolase|nr:HD domain-containing protein [Nanoarchaeota archaeon]